MNVRVGRVAIIVLLGIAAVSGGGCAGRSERTLGDGPTTTTTSTPTRSTATPTSSSPTTARPTTTVATTTTLPSTTPVAPTTAPPTPTAPELVPGGPCTLGSHPDCIDPDGDGAGTYLLFGADCMAGFSGSPGLCEDLDQDGVAGYPDSG